jgi:hypothetical protein
MYRITVSSGSSFDLKHQSSSDSILLDKMVETMDFETFRTKLNDAIHEAQRVQSEKPKPRAA